MFLRWLPPSIIFWYFEKKWDNVIMKLWEDKKWVYYSSRNLKKKKAVRLLHHHQQYFSVSDSCITFKETFNVDLFYSWNKEKYLGKHTVFNLIYIYELYNLWWEMHTTCKHFDRIFLFKNQNSPDRMIWKLYFLGSVGWFELHTKHRGSSPGFFGLQDNEQKIWSSRMVWGVRPVTCRSRF